MSRAREVLCDLVAARGRGLVYEPRRLENMMKDLCPDEKADVFVLVSALRTGIASQLLSSEPGASLFLADRLSRRLHDDCGFREAVARSAVETWAAALGVFPAACEEVVVCAQGNGHYPSIAQALRNVPPGARLVVRPGIYAEEIVLDKPVEIIGPGATDASQASSDRSEAIIESVSSTALRMATTQAIVRGMSLQGKAGLGSRSVFAVDISQGELLLDRCDISSRSLACVAIHGERTTPVLRHCRIHGAQGSGVFVHDGGAGTIEECEISGNALAGIEVGKAADPILRRCRITGGQQAGVYVSLGGAGFFEECEISHNGGAGVEIGWQGQPILRRCRISQNRTYGIKIYAGGASTVEDCDLAGNQLGAWNVEE